MSDCRLKTANCKLQIDGSRQIRRGVTLVELLVVIAILTLLMATAIPAMRPALEGRRIREAARQINIYLGSARARAMETGRPVGVVIRRFEGQPQCALVLEQAEVPPPYAGDTLDAAARLSVLAGTVIIADLTPPINVLLVNRGDLVQFNHQGPLYKIEGFSATRLAVSTDLSQGQMLPWPSAPQWSAWMPYEIFRQPTEHQTMKSAAAPLQLPAGAVIDLEASGTDDMLFGGAHTSPIYIMFSPNGAVDRIYRHGTASPVTEPIFLLVGKRERVPAGSAEDGRDNWEDLTNLWVTLSPQTGLVTTTEVAPQDPSDGDLTDGPHDSRDFARQAQSMGGR